MRWLVGVVLLTACGHEPVEFEFVVTLLDGTSQVTVDGVENPEELHYFFDSYEDAQAELVLEVAITGPRGTGHDAIVPGYCRTSVIPQNADLGTLLVEHVTYAASELTPTLELARYECRGDKLTVLSGTY